MLGDKISNSMRSELAVPIITLNVNSMYKIYHPGHLREADMWGSHRVCERRLFAVRCIFLSLFVARDEH